MLCLAQFSKPSFRQLSPHSLVYTVFIRVPNVNISNAEISKRSLPREDSEADEDRFTLNAISESLSYCEPPGDPEGEMVTGLDCTVPEKKKFSQLHKLGRNLSGTSARFEFNLGTGEQLLFLLHNSLTQITYTV